VPSSARDLPWLHSVHRLLLCPACCWAPTVSHLCSDMLLLASDWSCYHHRLDILFTDADVRIHPSGSLSSRAEPLISTDFLCLLADPLGFEDPSLGIPVTAWTRYLSNILAVAARLLGCVRPALSPLTPPRSPERACSTPPPAQTRTTMDSLDCSRASVSSVFWVLPRILKTAVSIPPFLSPSPCALHG
jgi:hypothetical protein